MENPKFFTDKQINSLIVETCNLISEIQLKFKGKIKLFGPLSRNCTNTLSLYLKTISIQRVTSLPIINRKESESFYSWVTALTKPNLHHTPSLCSIKTTIPCSTSSLSKQSCTMTTGTSTSTINTDDSSFSTSQASHIHHPSSFPDPLLLSDDETTDMEISKEDLAAALASLDMSYD